jgi:ABC-type Fe3+-hydroxamate transport system substrate-binding protein
MTIQDQIGNQIILSEPPKRIVSLVPSQTELLFSLGLEDEVVGITKFCIHPENWFRTKTRIGGTKNPHISKITSLNPDIIIANKEENREEDVKALRAICPVWTSDVHHLDDALNMIEQIGIVVNRKENADKLICEIRDKFNILSQSHHIKVAYLIWKNPYMSIGNDTFIHSMLQQAGFINVFANYTRYPVITEEMLKECNADYIFLSSEPYPFKEKHIMELNQILSQKNAHAKVLLVNGEYFSWYGSRLTDAANYLNNLINSLCA